MIRYGAGGGLGGGYGGAGAGYGPGGGFAFGAAARGYTSLQPFALVPKPWTAGVPRSSETAPPSRATRGP